MQDEVAAGRRSPERADLDHEVRIGHISGGLFTPCIKLFTTTNSTGELGASFDILDANEDVSITVPAGYVLEAA